jgi:hypothetical protein
MPWFVSTRTRAKDLKIFHPFLQVVGVRTVFYLHPAGEVILHLFYFVFDGCTVPESFFSVALHDELITSNAIKAPDNR